MAKDVAPEPLDPNFRLALPKFEGPLDLLLHLVQQHELDILDLPISFVTEKYLEYLNVMTRLDLDIAAEYLVMAATLAHIKSKMLLPPDPTQVDDEASPEEEVDPRAELIRRLLEYQKYKAAGAQLASRGLAGRDVFFRGTQPEEASGPAPLAEISLFKLMDAFQSVLKRANRELAFQVTSEGLGIQDRVNQLVVMLQTRRTCRFDELFDGQVSVYDIVVTFLAILEMGKRRLARIYQPGALEPIHIEYRVIEDGDGPPVADAAANDDDSIEPSIARPGEDPLGEAPGEPELDEPAASDELTASAEPTTNDEPTASDEPTANEEPAPSAPGLGAETPGLDAAQDRSIALDGLESDGEDEHDAAPPTPAIIERAGGDGEEE